jgi:hypothetical protein
LFLFGAPPAQVTLVQVVHVAGEKRFEKPIAVRVRDGHDVDRLLCFPIFDTAAARLADRKSRQRADWDGVA